LCFKVSPGIQFARPYLEKKEKNPITKRAGGMARGVDPEFKLQYHTHTKKKKQKKLEI
jgi:hypothetical protein